MKTPMTLAGDEPLNGAGTGAHGSIPGIETLAGRIGAELRARGLTMATAESCTGGMVGAACTSIAGASQWYRGGVVAYDNQVKVDLLGVSDAAIAGHGAVSRIVAQAMAVGALGSCGSVWAVSTTGIAGPDGGSESKPVGTVYVGVAARTGDGQVEASCRHFVLDGGRELIRQRAASCALASLWCRLVRRPDTTLPWEVAE